MVGQPLMSLQRQATGKQPATLACQRNRSAKQGMLVAELAKGNRIATAVRLEPVAPALERVGGQLGQIPLDIAEKSTPIDCRTVSPCLGKRSEETLRSTIVATQGADNRR